MHNNSTPAINGWSRQKVEAIKKTIAYGASEEELTMFLYLSQKTGLDPFANEIWFVKINGKNKILTGRDGYLKIANNHPAFQGMSSDVIYEYDAFRKTVHNGELDIFHQYEGISKRGKILGAWAKVWRKDRAVPTFFLAPMSDYDKREGVWLKYPHAMIVKVAEAMALKRAFAISGLCTQEELVPEEHQPSNAQRVRLRILWQDFVAYSNGNQEEAKKLIQSLVGERPSSTWNEEDIGVLEEFLLKNEILECEVIEE